MLELPVVSPAKCCANCIHGYGVTSSEFKNLFIDGDLSYPAIFLCAVDEYPSITVQNYLDDEPDIVLRYDHGVAGYSAAQINEVLDWLGFTRDSDICDITESPRYRCPATPEVCAKYAMYKSTIFI